MNKGFQSNERALIEYFGIEFGILVHDNMRVHKLELDKKLAYRLCLLHFLNSFKCIATPCTTTLVMLYWTVRLEHVSIEGIKGSHMLGLTKKNLAGASEKEVTD